MSARKTTHPNVLLICVDHWFGGLIGALGHPTILTPTLDRMIGNGIAYTNAYSATPTCIPARRELMTGTSARTHGDRTFNETLPMPNLPTMAQTFRDNGYQAYAVGKLHVYPQRDRIGFDDALVVEEGRHQFGMTKDDYEMFIQEEGFAGQEYGHGASNNDYMVSAWHLPEYLHQTNWTVREMSKFIARRDPRKPGFWYMSFSPPHPPLAPLPFYLDMYRSLEIDEPYYGDWSRSPDEWPFALRARPHGRDTYSPPALKRARQGFYALATHVDHQIRLVIGLLREEGILDSTAILFTSDHGDMLGNHGLFAKGLMYENSAKIPMVFMPPANRTDIARNFIDARLAVQADVFPTLAEVCGIPIPDTVEGLSMLGHDKREYIYGEHGEDDRPTRMIRDTRHKLIYYPQGNRTQLFDLHEDPRETRDLSNDPSRSRIEAHLTDILIENMYGGDTEWVENGALVGTHEPQPRSPHPSPSRAFGNQRGYRFGHAGPVSNRPTRL